MRKVTGLLTFIFFGLLPEAACACAVCFGQAENSNIGKAFTWGVSLMLVFTFLILAALGAVMFKIEARRKVLEGNAGQ